jgi:hypothetical protein
MKEIVFSSSGTITTTFLQKPKKTWIARFFLQRRLCGRVCGKVSDCLTGLEFGNTTFDQMTASEVRRFFADGNGGKAFGKAHCCT